MTTTRPLRPRLGAAGLLLALTACSGSSGGEAPTARESAPVSTEFCGALRDFQADVGAAAPGDPTAYAASLRAAADRLDAVGVPTDAPPEARAGLGLRVSALQGLPATPTQADLAALEPSSEQDRAALGALDAYVAATCPDL